MNNLYVGIDPDLKKSGFAVWDAEKQCFLELLALDIYQLVQYVNKYKEANFILEAGWLNKKVNFRDKPIIARATYLAFEAKTKYYQFKDLYSKYSKLFGSAQGTAKKVGENHGAGKLIEDILQKSKVKYKLIMPRESKTTPAIFNKLYGTNFKKAQQDIIDAGMLVSRYQKGIF